MTGHFFFNWKAILNICQRQFVKSTQNRDPLLWVMRHIIWKVWDDMLQSKMYFVNPCKVILNTFWMFWNIYLDRLPAQPHFCAAIWVGFLHRLLLICAPQPWNEPFFLLCTKLLTAPRVLNFGPHIYREAPPKTNINKLKQYEMDLNAAFPDPFNHFDTSAALFPKLLGEICFPTTTPLCLPRPGWCRPRHSLPRWGGCSCFGIGPWLRDGGGCNSLRMGREERKLRATFRFTVKATLGTLGWNLNSCHCHIYGRCAFQCGQHTSNSFALQMRSSYSWINSELDTWFAYLQRLCLADGEDDDKLWW